MTRQHEPAGDSQPDTEKPRQTGKPRQTAGASRVAGPSRTAAPLAGAKRPARPTRPTLTREYIVQMALAALEREGVDKFSMRKLGAEIGVDPMALYRYFPSKGALFDGVVEAIYREVDLTGIPAESWPEQVSWFMRRLRDALRRHPNTLPILSTRPATTPAMLDMLEHALASLAAAGLGVQQALDIVNCLAGFTMGHLMAEIGEPAGGETHGTSEAMAALSRETHPRLFEAFGGGFQYDPDAQFEAGLGAMLDGFTRRFAESGH